MKKSAYGLKEDIEKLRNELNIKVAKNIGNDSNEENEKILALSRELDSILIEYIKSIF